MRKTAGRLPLDLRTWIEVDPKTVQHNYKIFRRLLGPSRLMAVVKSNAYGHGLVSFSKLLASLAADWFGVDSILEAQRLRREGISRPILVLGYTRPENFKAAADLGISLTISTLDSLKLLSRSKTPRPLKLHLKVDTGMRRQGFLPADYPRALELLAQAPWLKVEGIYSHLAAGANKKASRQQLFEFENFLRSSRKLTEQPIRHLANTASALTYPQSHFDLARIGLGLYGLWPEERLRRRLGRRFSLRPTLTWKTIVSEVKTLPRTSAIGYDLTERVPAGTRLAICPVGYWHGYPRALSSRGRVRLRNKLVKVVGRVSMDMLVLNVTAVRGLGVGDEVILLNHRGRPTADEFAHLASTSNYEIITRLNPLMERFYI